MSNVIPENTEAESLLQRIVEAATPIEDQGHYYWGYMMADQALSPLLAEARALLGLPAHDYKP